MDGGNNLGRVEEEEKEVTEGSPGFLFDQPKQRKQEFWQCMKLVGPTMENKKWKASEAVCAWCTICNCEVKWKSVETNPVKQHMERIHKSLLRDHRKSNAGAATNGKEMKSSSIPDFFSTNVRGHSRPASKANQIKLIYSSGGINPKQASHTLQR